jgi:hypothetical protein
MKKEEEKKESNLVLAAKAIVYLSMFGFGMYLIFKNIL